MDEDERRQWLKDARDAVKSDPMTDVQRTELIQLIKAWKEAQSAKCCLIS